MAGLAAYGGVKIETWWVWGIQAVVKMGLMGFGVYRVCEVS